MSEDPGPFRPYIHLLSSTDLNPDVAAGEVVRADGTRQPVSAELMAAIDHLLTAVASDRSARIEPMSDRLWLVEAVAVTELGEERLRQMIAEGKVRTIPSPAGDLLQLRDVVLLDREFREERQQILQDMFDDTWADSGQAEGDGDS